MAWLPPALDLRADRTEALPPLGKLLHTPHRYWPKDLLDGGAIEVSAGKRRLIFIADPRAAHEILTDKTGRVARSKLQQRIFGRGYGGRLVQADMRNAAANRHEIAAPISQHRTRALGNRVQSACADMLGEWRALASGAPIPLRRDAKRLALDLLWRAFFAIGGNDTGMDPRVDAIARATSDAGEMTVSDELAALEPLASAVAEMAGHGLLADRPLASQGRDALLLFLHVGHHNVALSLPWAIWLLAHRPDLQDRIAAEWRKADGKDANPADHAVASAVVRESLRLYPPTVQVLREVSGGIEIDGKAYAGTFTACIVIYAMHRARRLWQRPDEFLPERFLGTGGKHETPAWMPFGAGPNGCIGTTFAQLELVTFLSMLVADFTIAPNPADPLKCGVEWGLRPEASSPILLSART